MKIVALQASGDMTILVCLLQKQPALRSEFDHFGSSKKPNDGVGRITFENTE